VIESLNQTDTADLSALFLTGEEESKARTLLADNADRERLSGDLKQLDEALRRAQPTQSKGLPAKELTAVRLFVGASAKVKSPAA
jgi:hypothetical protein